MKLVEVLIEYPSLSLDRPFFYTYDGEEIQKGVRVIIPFGKKKIVGYVLSFRTMEETREEYEKKNHIQLKSILQILDSKPLLNEELMNIAQEMAKYYFAPLISCYQVMLPPSLKPSISSISKPKIAYEIYVEPLTGEKELTKKQFEIYSEICRKKKVLKNQYSPSVIKKLLDYGYLKETKVEKRRIISEQKEREADLILNDEQQNAFDTILANPGDIFLLEGVTGSGKTEVYLHLTRKILEQGKNVLILVPEIGLSYQMVHQFETRFEKIAILHSGLTAGQKYDEYRRIASNEVSIVIGARSAIFAPLSNIGLIIIDEEHSESYKQENQPYYHALTVAKMRQQYHHCSILLGSATPSLESRSRAFKGVYHLIKMEKRIAGFLPKCTVVNLSDYKEIDAKSILYSKTVRKAIADCLQKKEQVMILINRRGYAPYVVCRKCGHVFRCPDCHLPLSFHQDTNQLMCHHCGYKEEMVSSCPKCHSSYLRTMGYGAQKAEEELKKLFPTAKLLRLDSDVSKKRTGAKNILEQFKNQDADILIGTQMISKGHDFKNVTLSVVLLADIGLNLPSFRAAERTFSMITQALGRAGRNKEGRAILQTYYPKHYVIELSSKQDYESFYALEMKYRKLNEYPPFCYCTILTLSAEKEDILNDISRKIRSFLVSEFSAKDVTVLGPSEYYVRILNKKFRRKFLLKYRNYNDIVPTIQKMQAIFQNQKTIQLTINVDPIEDY